jgi:hypothetical protein
MSSAPRLFPVLCRMAFLLGLAALLGVPASLARQNIRDAFFQVYPSAVGSAIDTVPSHPVHCGVCHYSFGGGGPRNPYGQQVEAALPGFPSNPAGRRQAIMSVENVDADGDGFTTLIEVTDTVQFPNTPTFPGLTPANVQYVSGVNLVDIENHLVPVEGGDTQPPDVTLIAPDGGELAVGNAPITVQWTASDASGIARIDLFLSDDGGATFRPMAAALLNTGTHVMYVPNRPTAQAIVRVVATDNALNVAHDDSNAPFTVAAPPGGTVPTTLRDFDLPGTQPFEGGTLIDALSCSACHGNYAPAVEPWFNWKGSMMAHASRDPLFEACMAIANQDAPDSGDLCLRCHLPAGWMRGRSVPTDGSQMIDADHMGVSCDLCHRMVDPIFEPNQNPAVDQAILAGLVDPPLDFGNGMFVADPAGTRRGPFQDAGLGHPILVSPFHREAAFCGTCHDVSNPAFERDAQGNYVPNAFDARPGSFAAHTLMPIERTYSEWLHSAYNTAQGVYAPQFGGNRLYVSSCQDCHMRAVTGRGCNFPEAPLRDDLPLHDMTGGSTWLAGLLPTLYPDLPLEVDPVAIQAGVLRARYMLQNAAELDAEQQGDELRVRVTNNSGHKLPTGYPEGRRMWLNVRFYDAGMTLLGESGAYDAETGVLADDPQIKTYEAKPGLDEVTAPLVGVPPGPSFHFVLNNKIFKDNRIPPRGFTNAGFAQFGGAPIGAVYADGQFWDDTYYVVPTCAATAEVTLYYQSTSKEYVEFLRDRNTTNSAGQFMYNAWNEHGKCPPELVATATITVWAPLDGDADGDGDVDQSDLGLVLSAFGACEGDPAYNPAADLTGDGCVTQSDLGLLLSNFGAQCP